MQNREKIKVKTFDSKTSDLTEQKSKTKAKNPVLITKKSKGKKELEWFRVR